MFTVYKHTTPNGKVYIGITSQKVENRWGCGKGYSKNKFFTNAIIKYGWENIKHEIICENLTKDEAEVKEIELIKKYNSTDRNFGYNISNGGFIVRLGIKHTDETKKKISLSCTGHKKSEEQNKRQSERQKGKTPIWCLPFAHSEKANKKRRETIMRKGCLKGKNLGSKSARAKKVKMFDLNGNYIKTFNAFSEAQKETNINYSSIVKVCRGQRKSAGGFFWQYV